MKKIHCLEGLRAILCVIVFLCHFRLAFLPNWEWWGDRTPFRFLTDGNAAVRLFFTLSGFVLAYKYLYVGKDRKGIPGDVLKRYFRLAPPIIVAEIAVYFLMKWGLFFNIQAGSLSGSDTFLVIFNCFSPNFFECLKEALGTCYFQGFHEYIGPLWTIQYEFLGSFLVLCALSICQNRIMRYPFYLSFFLFYGRTYYSYFVLGMLIVDLYGSGAIRDFLQKHGIVRNLLLCVSVGMFTMAEVSEGVGCWIFGIGVCFFFLTLLTAPWGEKILGNAGMKKVGELSYSIYIVHWPVIESFASAYYIWALGRKMAPLTMHMTNLLFTVLLVVLAAWLLHECVEKPSCHFLNRRIDELVGKYCGQVGQQQ